MNDPGKVITFYSYKGGTGRTMALANAGVLLARERAGKVLMIDWDLEAPGLHNFFPELQAGQEEGTRSKPGVLEAFERLDELSLDAPDASGDEIQSLIDGLELDQYIAETAEPSLHMMAAGRLDESYQARVSAFPWQPLFERSSMLFKAFADELASRYRYVLIDSRTGLSDSSGVCTMLLPERLVVVFTPNQQSLTGVVKLVRDATTYRSQSPDLRPLLVFPLASRVEMSEEDLRREWRNGSEATRGYQRRFELLFEEVYDLPECHLEPYFDEVQIQHAARYAYGERVAVRDESSDRLSLSRSYEQFTRALRAPGGAWTFEKEPKPKVATGKRADRVLAQLEDSRQTYLLAARVAGSRNSLVVLGEALLAVGTLGGLLAATLSEVVPVVSLLPLLVAAVTVIGGIEYLRRQLAFDDRYTESMRTANALARERSLFESRAGRYADAPDAVALLTERYEGVLMDAEDVLLGRPGVSGSKKKSSKSA